MGRRDLTAHRQRRVPTLVVLLACVAIATSACTGGSSSSGASKARNNSATTSSQNACNPARPAAPGSKLVKTKLGGIERDYELSIPPGYTGAMKAPLLLSIHGFTTTIAQQDKGTQFPREAGMRGYIVVTPQAPTSKVTIGGTTLDTPLWNIPGAFSRNGPTAGDDVSYLNGLLNRIESTLCVDKDREYVSGISNGAEMTMALICIYDRRFAAAAPVSGVNLLTTCNAKHATPLIAFHGTADPLVNYNGGSVLGANLNLPSVPARMAQFAALGGCATPPTTTQPYADVSHSVWRCPGKMGLELYTVIGGGHAWPGAPTDGTRGKDLPAYVGYETQSIDATNLILDFFNKHHR
jgi:polyhydroxybutyrate depolymerase